MVAYMLGSIVICHHNISCASNDALYTRLCTYSSGVRTKFGIDMVLLGELGTTRSSKEGWTGPGRRRSRSKPPCRSVVGSLLRIDTAAQPERYSETQTFAFVSEWWQWKKGLEMNNMIKNSIIMKSFHSCQLQIMVLSHFQVVNLFNLK